MKYAAHVAELGAASAAMAGLWVENLTIRGDPQERIRWYYRENPQGQAAALLLGCEEILGAAPVGCCGIGARTVWRDGRELRAGLLADFAVSRAHRTVMPALVLQRAVREYAAQRYDLCYGFPNASAKGVVQRAGFTRLGAMGRYVKVLRHAPFIGRSLGRALGLLGGVIPDAVAWAGESARRLHTGGAHRLVPVERPDDRFARLFERARARHGLIGDRGPAFLRWRFLDRPGPRAEIHALVSEPAGEVRAYAVVSRKHEGTALLADFLAEDERALGVLLDRLAPVLRAQGFPSATAYFFGPARIAAVLRERGFRLRDTENDVVAAPGLSAAPSLDPEAWYLTDADRDS